jgi:hypothetical protein
MAPLPVEWMDPLSWRLPSGKALAEFALQSGFLWPLMLGGPRVRKRTPGAKPAVAPQAIPGAVMDKQREAPDPSGSFRETR